MDTSSGFEMARAAWAIISSCVHDFKHEGGRADGLGTSVYSPPC